MIYILIALALTILIAGLVWYFLIREKNNTRVIKAHHNDRVLNDRVLNDHISNDNHRQSQDNVLDTAQWNGVPEPSTFLDVTADESAIAKTERIMLDMARSEPPHPHYVFQSRGAEAGDPFRGDLVIKPRTTGIYLPYNAEPSDLRLGYFS